MIDLVRIFLLTLPAGRQYPTNSIESIITVMLLAGVTHSTPPGETKHAHPTAGGRAKLKEKSC
jgi:hypothetical protein